MRVIDFLKGLVSVWGLLLATLDTPGGYFVMLGVLMGVGGWLLHNGVMEGGSILTGAFGALLGGLTMKRHSDSQSEGVK